MAPQASAEETTGLRLPVPTPPKGFDTRRKRFHYRAGSIGACIRRRGVAAQAMRNRGTTSLHALIRSLTMAIALTAFVSSPSRPALAGAGDTQLAGRTLEVMVGFSNTGDGARFWKLFSKVLRSHLPDTAIRARFNDTDSGVQGTSELFHLPAGSLAVGFVRPPEIAFAQLNKRDGVDFDLRQARWISAVEQESFIMVARRDLPTDPQALRDATARPILPVSDILATHATVGVLLNAVTGIRARIVVGFGNSARLKGVLAGDLDFYTAAADTELQPLLASQDVQSLYTIVGSEFPPEVDRSRTLETFLVPGAPASVVDFIKAARGMGRAFFAPPGVSQQDVDALRAVFHAVLTSPDFINAAASQGIPIAAVDWSEVDDGMARLMPDDPAVQKQLDHAYRCGLAMSDGSIVHCDF